MVGGRGAWRGRAEIGKRDAHFLLIDAISSSIRGTKATYMLLSANPATLHNGAALMQQ